MKTNYYKLNDDFGLLTLEEEMELAKEYKRTRDPKISEQLVMSNMRYVYIVACKFLGYKISLDDLVQEGAVGLVKALDRYDPEVGVRLMSFAIHWVKAEINNYILRTLKITRVATTKQQRKLFFGLRGAKKTYDGWMGEKELAELAEAFGTSPELVREMEGRLHYNTVPFNTLDPYLEYEEGEMPSIQLPDSRTITSKIVEEEEYAEIMACQLHAALGNLDDRSSDIIRSRWLSEDKPTLSILADKYHITAERVRQIESNAMKEMRQEITT